MRKPSRANVEASPHKSVAEELETVRKLFRGVWQRYGERVENEIGRIHEKVRAASARNGKSARPSASNAEQARMRDLRDMLILMRSLQVKPAADRRKDLKKIESVVEDLQLLTEHWA